ncbi:MAG TPA: hypothetical protein PK772_04340 [Chitinophagaceae bacterium]|nr:hypothetical protein [Chitinophagaceae bacterium]
MIKKNGLQFIGLVVLTQLLTACSPLQMCYLRNTTKDSISLTLKSSHPNTAVANKPLFVRYKNGVADIKTNLHTELHQQVEVKKIDDYTLKVVIPPQSTVLLNRWSHSFNLLCDSKANPINYSIGNIIIKTLTKETILSETNISKDFGHKEIGSASIYYYDVQ